MVAATTEQKPDLGTILQNAVTALGAVIAEKPDTDRLLSELVRLSGGAVSAGGAGMWITDSPDKPELVLEQSLVTLGLMNGQTIVNGIVSAVRRCAREAKSLIVPPFFVDHDAGDIPVNPSPFELLFVPMKLHAKVSMVLMMAVPPSATTGNDAAAHRTYLNFLARMIGAAESTLIERQMSLIEKDRGTSSKLVRFADEVHKHLFLHQVAVDIANLTRDVMDSQRATVELYPRLKKKILAVSNVDEPNKRAKIFQVQRLIFDYVRDRQVSVMLDREAAKQLVSDPVLQDAAVAYFAATEFEAFLAAPIKLDDAKSTVKGVILVEYASTATAQANSAMLSDVARLCTGAVTNAMEFEAIPLRHVLHGMARMWKKPTGTRKALALSLVAVVTMVIVLLGVIPFDFSIRADCQLRPMAQLSIAAPVEQRILDIPVRAAEHVYPKPADGESRNGAKPLAIFDSTELIASRAEQYGKRGELQVQLKEAERKGEITKIGGIKLQIEQVEKQIALLDHQIDQCTVWSPIEGIVLTEKVESKKWSTPRKSDPLMEVASFADWELAVDVPESEVATVRAALLKATKESSIDGQADKGIEVEYILYPWPDQRYAVKARGIATLLPASMQSKNANVFRLQVKLDPKSLPPGISMSGVTGRAKIHVGSQPLAQQWTRGAVRLVRMMMFF